jgi:hypothetical protein
MVIDQIEVEGVTILKTEGEPPISADRQAPAAFELAFQLMQPVARKPAQIVERVGCVDLGQQTPQPLGLIGANAAGVVLWRKLWMAMSEPKCKPSFDGCQ